MNIAIFVNYYTHARNLNSIGSFPQLFSSARILTVIHDYDDGAERHDDDGGNSRQQPQQGSQARHCESQAINKTILTRLFKIFLLISLHSSLALVRYLRSSAFFYNFLLVYWSMISFVLRIQIGIDLFTNLDKALYW